MDQQMKPVSAIAIGALFPAAVLLLAASAPLMNDPFISPVDGRILTLGWWLMVPLGVAFAVMRSKRLWAGAVVGILSVIAYDASILLLPASERSAAAGVGVWWLGGFITIAIPWAIGMVLGWTSAWSQRRHYDGVSPEPRP